MTEEQWLATSDPGRMLSFLVRKEQVSDRKLRLFAVACCRRIWHLIQDNRSRKAVEIAEEFADGQRTIGELADANAQARVAYDAVYHRTWSWSDRVPEQAAWFSVTPHQLQCEPVGSVAWQIAFVADTGEAQEEAA